MFDRALSSRPATFRSRRRLALPCADERSSHGATEEDARRYHEPWLARNFGANVAGGIVDLIEEAVFDRPESSGGCGTSRQCPAKYRLYGNYETFVELMGWLMGLEPTTTGITIRHNGWFHR